MFGLRAPELILIIAAIVLLFGATRLPQLARSIGASKKAFKEGLRDSDDEPALSAQQLRSTTDHSDDEVAAELARRRTAETASK